MKNVFLDKGIILPSGEINKDKINLVAGAITQPLAEMVWITTGGDMETMSGVFIRAERMSCQKERVYGCKENRLYRSPRNELSKTF